MNPFSAHFPGAASPFPSLPHRSPVSRPFFSSATFLFQHLFLRQVLRGHLLLLLTGVLVHTQVRTAHPLHHSLDFCSLLIFGKPLEIRDKPRVCFQVSFIHPLVRPPHAQSRVSRQPGML